MSRSGDDDVFEALALLVSQFTDLVRMMSEGLENGLDLDRVVQFAAHSVPGAEHAGISMVSRNSRPRTLASTSDLAATVDALAYDCAEGPCMQVLDQSDIVFTSELAEDPQWPKFAPLAVQRTGIHSLLSFRLFLTGSKRGALNFYASEPNAFPELAMPVGAIFASYASLTLLNLIHSDEAMHLQRALETNREIGVAIGILMARELCTHQEAFGRLRHASSHLNRKLREVADEVARTGRLPETPE